MHLNYLPLRFTSDAFKGGVLHFAESGKKQSGQESPLAQKLQELRRDQGRDYIFHYSGNDIYCIPLKADAMTIGDPKQFNTLTDFQLANVLARSALESFFKRSKRTVIGHKPMYLLLEEHNLASDRQDVFGLFPEYSLDVRPLAPHEGDISSGILIGFGIRYLFLRNVAELQAEGINPIGQYVVRLDDAENPSPYHRRYLGRIDSIANGIAALSDSDFSDYPLDQCYFEGSRTNIEYVGRTLLGRNYESFSNNLLTQTFNVMGADNQVMQTRWSRAAASMGTLSETCRRDVDDHV